MRISFRHSVGFAAVALMLASCGVGNYGPGPRGVAPQSQEIKWGRNQNPPPAKVAGLNAWVANFKGQARGQGISDQTLEFAFRDVVYNPEVVKRSQNQAEFKKSLWEYLENAVSEKRQSNGRAALGQYGGVLNAVEARYGVDKEVVTAVWGMESTYGERRGDLPLIEALSTLSYEGYRGDFFRSQLIAALKILQAGDIDPAHMTGSWAGAMGHTQFIPTTYLAYAADFNGDGRRDIWSDDPTDALASTAHYLRQNGWQPGQPWGAEVILPSGFDWNQVSKSVEKSGSQWAAMGVRTASGRPVPSGAIIAPAGARGPAFLITQNFRAILKYNASDSYALAVSFLGDAIAGRSGIQGAWPRGDRTLSNSEKAEIQRLLMARGFDTGGADGKLGAKSVEAVKGFQRSRGMVPDGYADANLLALLRG